MLFSEPKIPQSLYARARYSPSVVSVLFSEPKIPQSGEVGRVDGRLQAFQCSSASRKFLNGSSSGWITSMFRFSALQRAENSSISSSRLKMTISEWFQCSSASRKFLNSSSSASSALSRSRFSALQRAENSSIDEMRQMRQQCAAEFQCSSASRKFLNGRRSSVSLNRCGSFSALQRAENSSIHFSV